MYTRLSRNSRKARQTRTVQSGTFGSRHTMDCNPHFRGIDMRMKRFDVRVALGRRVLHRPRTAQCRCIATALIQTNAERGRRNCQAMRGRVGRCFWPVHHAVPGLPWRRCRCARSCRQAVRTALANHGNVLATRLSPAPMRGSSQTYRASAQPAVPDRAKPVDAPAMNGITAADREHPQLARTRRSKSLSQRPLSATLPT